MRKGDAAGVLSCAHLPVGRVDARRVDVDEDFPGRRTRVRQVPVLENLRPAEAAEEGSFHSRSRRPKPAIGAATPATRSAFHIIAAAADTAGLPRSRSMRSSVAMVGMPTPLRNTA